MSALLRLPSGAGEASEFCIELGIGHVPHLDEVLVLLGCVLAGELRQRRARLNELRRGVVDRKRGVRPALLAAQVRAQLAHGHALRVDGFGEGRVERACVESASIGVGGDPAEGIAHTAGASTDGASGGSVAPSRKVHLHRRGKFGVGEVGMVSHHAPPWSHR